jgi:hypothetical protein
MSTNNICSLINYTSNVTLLLSCFFEFLPQTEGRNKDNILPVFDTNYKLEKQEVISIK